MLVLSRNRSATVLGKALAIALSWHLYGCADRPDVPRFELRWCAHGEATCVLKQDEGAYVKGGYFFSLDQCSDAVRHLAFYGNKVGAACIEIPDRDRQNLKGGK